ncbi:hypothetical protein [Spongiivirga citrea]|uniref:Uncharacterized protein n=1 Tax=Spongiivirga citrea TaxID=1481457 RepID=A0A6M0CDD2_9FLAO|nr:hypothetical protein [Spongiivirga citrea]NER15731.1 hypothetical protein [Spongiivirga citrea]
MNTVSLHSEEKSIHIQIVDSMPEVVALLEDNIKHKTKSLHTSILGKLNISETKKHQLEAIIDKQKQTWKRILKSQPNFNYHNTAEVGILFSVGPISKILANKVNGKAIAELSNGIYGVLRGLGASEFQAASYIKALQNDRFIIIQRESLEGIDKKHFSRLYKY